MLHCKTFQRTVKRRILSSEDSGRTSKDLKHKSFPLFARKFEPKKSLAKEQLGKVENFEAIPGSGISCDVEVEDDKYKILIGNRTWMSTNKVLVPRGEFHDERYIVVNSQIHQI